MIEVLCQMPEPQPAINLPQTRHAIFLVYGVKAGPTHAARVRRVCGDLDALLRAVGTRAPDVALSAVVAFGADAWDRLIGPPQPAELHPFREFRAGARIAPATPGDLFFHVTADDLGVCYELAAQIFAQLGESVTLIDETHGFRYFDDRDLTGFVDGTENPVGAASVAATIVGDEDPAFAGGSYVMVQKYVHDHAAWNSLPTEVQEGIIGRRKLDDIELDDDAKPPFAHNALTVIEENGEEIQIRRHNLPFGSAGGGESGTYFIGYVPVHRAPWRSCWRTWSSAGRPDHLRSTPGLYPPGPPGYALLCAVTGHSRRVGGRRHHPDPVARLSATGRFVAGRGRGPGCARQRQPQYWQSQGGPAA